MNDPLITWAIILIGVAVVLFFVELFVPSGGLIALVSAACLLAGIVMLFRVNTALGLVGATVAVLGMPFLFAIGIRLWPNTPIARRLALYTPTRDANAEPHAGGAVPEGPAVGAEGEAVTDLRPVGTCVIDGLRIECLAEGGVIRAHTRVRVVARDGMHTKVRPAEA